MGGFDSCSNQGKDMANIMVYWLESALLLSPLPLCLLPPSLVLNPAMARRGDKKNILSLTGSFKACASDVL